MKLFKLKSAALACAAMMAGGFAAGADSKAEKTTTKPIELTKIDQLKTAFNRHHGVVRLVLLLSPT